MLEEDKSFHFLAGFLDLSSINCTIRSSQCNNYLHCQCSEVGSRIISFWSCNISPSN